jgi:hypothetical protein
MRIRYDDDQCGDATNNTILFISKGSIPYHSEKVMVSQNFGMKCGSKMIKT